MTNSLVPVVKLQDGKPVTNSRDVADMFGKEHYNVLRDIRNMEMPSELKASFFIPIRLRDKYDREMNGFNMTRDGFALLAMGFTGKKALQFKVAYINRFNEMEAELREIHRSSHLGNVTVHEFFLGEHRPVAMPSGS